MYADHQFLPHLLLILKPATLFSSLPFRWNKKTRRMEYAFTTDFQRRIYRLKCNLHVTFTLVIIFQVVLTNTTNPAMKPMCIFTVAMLTLTTVVVKEYSIKDRDATSLLTRFIQSSGESQERMDSYERKRKIAVDLLNPGTCFFPFLYTVGVAWVFPCLPANFAFWIVPECSTGLFNFAFLGTGEFTNIFGLLRKFIFAAINFWIWSFGMHATDAVGSGVVMIGAMHFRGRLKQYQRKMGKIQSDHDREAYKVTLIYREIQVLCRQYNCMHQRTIIVAIILAVISTQSICIYAIVEFHSDMQWILQVFFVMMGVDCFMAIIMVCGTLADTFDLSQKILRDVRRKHRGCHCRWLMRFHRSCQEIKMKFGMTNFMEKMTPLNFENFSICQAVNMLMVKE